MKTPAVAVYQCFYLKRVGIIAQDIICLFLSINNKTLCCFFLFSQSLVKKPCRVCISNLLVGVFPLVSFFHGHLSHQAEIGIDRLADVFVCHGSLDTVLS